MEYIARIRNGLGLKSAEISLKPGSVVVVTGNNATGKSTLATLVGAAFCEKANPLLAESPKGAYVTDGEIDGGEVTIRKTEDGADDETLVFWDLASNEMSVSGGGIPPSSPATVGLIDFTAKQGVAARQKTFEDLLMPPTDTLVHMLRKKLHGLVSDNTLEEVLGVVVDDGLDAVDEAMKSRARKAKADWQKITNVARYGMEKARDWLPEGWTTEMDGKTIAEAEQELAKARNEQKAATTEQVISVTERAEAQEAAAKLPDEGEKLQHLQWQLKELKSQHQEKCEVRDEKYKELQKVQMVLSEHKAQQPHDISPAVCPCCKAELLVRSNNNLVEFNSHNHEVAKTAWRGKLNELNSDEINARATYDALRAPAEQAGQEVNQFSEVVYRKAEQIRALEQKAEKADMPLDSDERQLRARDAELGVEKAEAQLAMIQRAQAAREAHERNMQYSEVVKQLGSKGFKAEAMETAMRNLNAVLKRISERTGWGPIQVVPVSYMVRYGEHIFPSESERWRAQVSLQIAMQLMLRDPVVVIDRADVLDDYSAEEFAGLVKITVDPLRPDGEPKKMPPPAFLICGTTTAPEDIPPWMQHLEGMPLTWHHTEGATLTEGDVIPVEEADA